MKLISGGQTGVDRAVLDLAVERGIAYGGWCPLGGWAEDCPVPPGVLARYPLLQETPLADPAQRTEWNVRDADACIVVLDAGGVAVSAGTTLAQHLAHRYRRPLLVINLAEPESRQGAEMWLRVQEARRGAALKLAIGGPRQSEAPGIYEGAKSFLGGLLDRGGALTGAFGK